MHECSTCGAGYLDPRPTPETIGRAYANYFTHERSLDYAELGALAKLRRRLANGYRNARYGTTDAPSNRLGLAVAALMPNVQADIDAGMRHLPRPAPGDRLLDLGCGNGEFLSRARSAGWEVVGVDFDEEAVGVAKGRGLDVRLGGVEVLDPKVERFHVITMSHVIEHVHDPRGVIEACHALLRPGGLLWMETPNIASIGHETYRSSWRGLEAPRHLVIFNHRALRQTLSNAGFVRIEDQPYRPLCRSLFDASIAIEAGVDPNTSSGPRAPSKVVSKAERLAAKQLDRRELITLKAWRD
jgi:2-polyprenyl-3-methyl-5-hydroxy-6-metoxy-1,4-benzoquinol methylase